MVEADQSSYGIYVAFAYESDQAMAIIAPFKIKDLFYVNNKSGDEKYKFFSWDLTKGFLLINKVIKKNGQGWRVMTSSEAYSSFMARLSTYIADNKKQTTTVVVEIGDMTTVAVKIKEAAIVIFEIKDKKKRWILK